MMTQNGTAREIINPFDDSVIASVSESSEADVNNAIARAKSRAPEMAEMPAYKRGMILDAAAEIIEAEGKNLARTMAQESGKPMKYALGEVARCVETFTFAADEARRLHGETVPMDAARSGVGKLGYYIRVPVGVIGAITPFNFPLNLVAHKVAPAVAAGCPIVLKPSPATPLTALRLAEIMREAGLPDGGFEVVVGDVDVGRWLTTHPDVAMITFTGSPGVARKISEVVGLRRVTFELGGNAATVIDEDGNVNHAVSRTVMGSFAYSGQTCISVQRIYVHQARYDEFCEQFVEMSNQLKLGNPLEEDTDLGPLINTAAADRIQAWVAEALSRGAKMLTGGDPDGKLYPATVLENVSEDMNVMCAEVFGPVVSLVPFNDFDAVLNAVNDSPFGLQAGVYTSSLNRAIHATQKLNVGGIMINDVPTYRADHMPYGGVKDSGVGREGPRFAIEEMTEMRMVVLNLGV